MPNSPSRIFSLPGKMPGKPWKASVALLTSIIEAAHEQGEDLEITMVSKRKQRPRRSKPHRTPKGLPYGQTTPEVFRGLLMELKTKNAPRGQNQISDRAFARMLGTNTAQLWRLVNGKTKVSGDSPVVQAIAREVLDKGTLRLSQARRELLERLTGRTQTGRSPRKRGNPRRRSRIDHGDIPSHVQATQPLAEAS